MRLMVHALAVATLSVGLVAQAGPAFEVASVRPSAEQNTQVAVGIRISGSQVRISYLSLKDYIGIAYGVRLGQVVAPDWVGQARFDIAAKIPDGEMPLVEERLRALLAERFALKVHTESREFPVYVLAVQREGLLPEAPPDTGDAAPAGGVSVTATGSAAGVGIDLGGGSSFGISNNRVDAKKVTMTALADGLTRFLDRPVIDRTNLTGRYDLAVDLSPEDYTAMLMRSALNAGVMLPPQALRALDAASLDPLSAPLRKYGLGLTAQRAPLEVVVVDDVRRSPTEN